MTGNILLSAGYLLSGYSKTKNKLVIAYGVPGGIGVGMLYGVPVVMDSRWFTDFRGIATLLSILILYVSLSVDKTFFQ